MDIGPIMRFEPRMAGRLEDLKRWASHMKRDVVALWLAARDRRTPWIAKACAAAVAAYALSPIDLIPDFIPVLGYVDDLILVPLGIRAVLKLIPPPLLEEFRAAAVAVSRPSSRTGLILVPAAWAALLLLAAATAL